MDLVGRKVYWTDRGTDALRRAGLDGTDPEVLVSGLIGVRGVAVDPSRAKVYWTHGGDIRRANLDGTDVEQVLSPGAFHLALDPVRSKLYWTSWSTIQRANLDGTEIEVVVTDIERPEFIALDWRDDLPLSHQFDYVLPAGLSLFSTALHAFSLSQSNDGHDLMAVDATLMARHLIGLGSTVVLRLEEGNFKAVIGRGGVLLVGQDFPVEAGKGYVINMLAPTAYTMAGVPHGVPIEDTTAMAPAAAPIVWAFVISGAVDDASLLPPGTIVRVTHTDSAEARDVPLSPEGCFMSALVDGSRKDVVADGDVLRFQLLTRDGYPLGASVDRRLGRADLRQVYATVRLNARPETAGLLPNYPNPFNPETWIPFQLVEPSDVVVRVHDTSGELVRTLDVGYRNEGYHVSREASAFWDGRNEAGEPVASGLYIAHLEAGNFHDASRLAVQK